MKEVTWDEANQHCASEGKRLCKSQEELNRCCDTGCGYDHELVWSSLKQGITRLLEALQLQEFELFCYEIGTMEIWFLIFLI